MVQAVLSHAASRLVSLDELALIPAGAPIGPRHKPVPHGEVVTVVRDAFERRGYTIEREQFSVTHDGARLFGTLDLLPIAGRSMSDGMETGMAVGLRHSNDCAFALGVIAGMRVFVCDNLAFSGAHSLVHRKHTTGLDLAAEVQRGLDRAFGSYHDLAGLVEKLKNTPLSDDAARLLIYGLALDGDVVAPNQLGKIHAWYFEPDEIASDADIARGLDDVMHRSAYGVMSAVTRLCRELAPHRQQDIGVRLSTYLEEYFRMAPYEARMPEAS